MFFAAKSQWQSLRISGAHNFPQLYRFRPVPCLMKNLLLSVLMGTFAVSTLPAQTPEATPAATEKAKPKAGPGKGEKGKPKLDKLKTELTLTDDQAQKIQAIMEEQGKAGKSIKEDTALSKEQKMEKMKAHRTETDAKIKAVLTPEQQAKWAELKKNRPAKGPKPEAKKDAQ